MSELKMLTTRLFNESTHHYKLTVDRNSFDLQSNEESQDFNVWLKPQDDALFEGKAVATVFCLGNQHAAASVRDLVKIMRQKKLDESLLCEYTMFTIGDFVILTQEEIIHAINGDVTRTPRAGEFVVSRGRA